jgi:transposase InsO family protein
MDGNYKTPLIVAAVKMAARHVSLPGEAIFHSDRGSDYTSAEFARELAVLGIRQSVGRTVGKPAYVGHPDIYSIAATP